MWRGRRTLSQRWIWPSTISIWRILLIRRYAATLEYADCGNSLIAARAVSARVAYSQTLYQPTGPALAAIFVLPSVPADRRGRGRARLPTRRCCVRQFRRQRPRRGALAARKLA